MNDYIREGIMKDALAHAAMLRLRDVGLVRLLEETLEKAVRAAQEYYEPKLQELRDEKECVEQQLAGVRKELKHQRQVASKQQGQLSCERNKRARPPLAIETEAIATLGALLIWLRDNYPRTYEEWEREWKREA